MARLTLVLAASTILAMATPAMAQDTPAFRVPMGSSPTSTTVEPSYAWLETLGNCSTTCGTGTRSTSYQCQNVADYDYSGAGYGLPEPDSACVAASGPKPAATSSSCTVYSGCGYDWVKPPVTETPVPLGSNPVGRLGCGYVKTVYSPYCQRTGGGSNVVMANGDHRFCSGDRPDYDPVAAGDPDALGYDRNVTQTNVCNTTDHDWKTADWGSWSSGCDSAATRIRTVSCVRRFDATGAPDTSCDPGTRPTSSETSAQYGSCSYSYTYGAYGAWSSGCDTNATRTRTATCTRSNNGGQAVPESECTSRGIAKEATSETGAQYGSCSYAFQPSAWSAWSSGCDANATRTRSVPCVRSNNGGETVADTECTSRGQTKPATSETGGQYGSCSYSYSAGSYGSWSSTCSATATRTRSVTCVRNNNGGTAVADSECDSRGVARPPSSETTAQYGGCSYARGGYAGSSGWMSGCSSNTTRTHYYSCVRQDGNNTVVADSECTSRGVSLTSTESGANYSSCTYSLQDAGLGACQSNNLAPHYWNCIRNQTGEYVDSSTYCGRSNPTYESCSYTPPVTYSLIDSGVGACQSNNQAPHYWSCRRSTDGAYVDSATYCGRSNPTYESCSYTPPVTYSLQDAGVGACQSNSQAPHYWRCIRSTDGAQVDSATYCGRSNPTYESCSYTPPVTYSIEDAGVGACQSNSQRPHYWNCRRSNDNQLVDSATYCGRSNPTYESCTYTPTYTYRIEDAGLGACQSNNQAPHYWRCIRNEDGAQVDSATYCGRANPTYESCSYYSYSLEDAGVGACQSNNTVPHYWNCRRNPDNQYVDSATYCGRSNPTYDSCSYQPPVTYSLEDAGVGQCQTNDTAPHYWNCRRSSDGQLVDSATFCNRNNPTYDSCTYQWGYTPTYGGFGACSAGTQTRSMTSCTRSDGTAVANSFCTNAGHPATQSQSCQSGPTGNCTYVYGVICASPVNMVYGGTFGTIGWYNQALENQQGDSGLGRDRRTGQPMFACYDGYNNGGGQDDAYAAIYEHYNSSATVPAGTVQPNGYTGSAQYPNNGWGALVCN